ncbi:MAG TPA: hypothetical protein VF407_23395 [Polyangiaceae bacterium]
MNVGRTETRFLDAATAPLDEARQAALAVATKSRHLTRIIARRDLRIPFLATLQIVILGAVTAVRPLWLFVLGPIVLGIPHLASDVRYLVLRQRVAREVIFVGIAAVALFLGFQGLELAHRPIPHWASLEVATATAWILAAILSGAREREGDKTFFLLPLLFVLAGGVWACSHAGLFRILLAHAHNVVGVIAWLVVFRKHRKAALLPVAALTLVAGLLLSGFTLGVTSQWKAFGIDLAAASHTLAPGLPARWALGAVLSFVFLQSIHYAAWLVWIPQDNLPGEGTFTFRMTARSLLADFGGPALAIIAALCVALAGAAAFDAKSAVRTYMSLATFHGYFEIALLAYFAARGRGRATPAS